MPDLPRLAIAMMAVAVVATFWSAAWRLSAAHQIRSVALSQMPQSEREHAYSEIAGQRPRVPWSVIATVGWLGAAVLLVWP